MNVHARRILTVAAICFFTGTAFGQVVMQPTPAPTLTAENEPWYLDGRPITYAGNLYYPSGPEVFFNPNEMVRSGFFNGIPLYVRTTIEPYSIVYVPLAGGRMQPYERPRSGELAQTAGSQPSTIPSAPQAVGSIGIGRPSEPLAAGTAGVPAPAPRLIPIRPGVDPRRTGSLYVEFEKVRWYPISGPRAVDTARMVRVGEYGGFPVWRDPQDPGIIYIPATHGSSVAVPYTRTHPTK